MKRRGTPKENPPNRWPWMRATIPSFRLSDDPIVLRAPSMGRAQTLIREWVTAQESADLEAQERSAAQFVRRSWADPTFEFESDPRDIDGIIDELQEVGIEFQHLAAIVAGVMEQVNKRSVTEDDVKSLVDFTG